jgi:hypothetical protein
MKFRKVFRNWDDGRGKQQMLVMRSVFTKLEGPISVEEVYHYMGKGKIRRWGNTKRMVYDTWKFTYVTCGLKCDLDWNGGEE